MALGHNMFFKVAGFSLLVSIQLRLKRSVHSQELTGSIKLNSGETSNGSGYQRCLEQSTKFKKKKPKPGWVVRPGVTGCWK